jgi:endogenous inhibitor of DNA gyrase (YacG/DUF329 family)
MPAKPPAGAGRRKAAPKEAVKQAVKQAARESVKASAKPCPICGKPATAASRPFCSERCRDVDLNRWLSNSYAIPAAKDDDEDAE